MKKTTNHMKTVAALSICLLMQLKQLKKDQLKGGNKIEKVLDSVPEEQTFDCMLLLASLAKSLIVHL